jgi:hypothetical protein
VNSEEENEQLRPAIDEPFSVQYQDLCRIMDLEEALTEITGSSEAEPGPSSRGRDEAAQPPAP